MNSISYAIPSQISTSVLWTDFCSSFDVIPVPLLVIYGFYLTSQSKFLFGKWYI